MKVSPATGPTPGTGDMTVGENAHGLAPRVSGGREVLVKNHPNIKLPQQVLETLEEGFDCPGSQEASSPGK